MRVVMFAISIFFLICSIVLLYSAIINDSPMYIQGIVVMLILFLGSVVLVKITYNELRNNK